MKFFAPIFASLCLLSECTLGQDFRWPEQVIEGLESHKRYAENGTFFATITSPGEPTAELTVRSRPGNTQLEFAYDNGPKTVFVSRPDGHFRLVQNQTGGEWVPTSIDHGRIAYLPMFSDIHFPFTLFGKVVYEIQEDEIAFEAESEFDATKPFRVHWKSSDGARYGTMTFDPSVHWGCTSQTSGLTGSGEETQVATYESRNGHQRLSRLVSSDTGGFHQELALFELDSQPADKSFFSLVKYGLSENLLIPLKPSAAGISFEFFFICLGIGLLFVGIALQLLGLKKRRF